ncbi:hypothetical protein V491_03851, partial [Pseudogymnoascus sp. VKM F-3775]
GLPELVSRSDIARAKRIANPGCYATAAQIGIAPLVEFLGGQPTVFGVSGYSGAGTKPSPKNDVENLRENLIPYSLTDHIHEREISSQLGVNVAFIPHVASWFQGIHHTISVPLDRTFTSRDIRQIYQDRYAGEKLVKVTGEPPSVKAISGKHGVEVGGFGVHSSGKRVVVCATIDNLLKGAATQCLQNMNLALGFAETPSPVSTAASSPLAVPQPFGISTVPTLYTAQLNTAGADGSSSSSDALAGHAQPKDSQDTTDMGSRILERLEEEEIAQLARLEEDSAA